MMCGPVIQLIGMGMGLLIWGGSNMLMGWATGTFGLYGLSKDDIKTPALNYVGISVVLIGLYIFLQVKTNEMHTNTDPVYKALIPESDPEKPERSNLPPPEHLHNEKVRNDSISSIAGPHPQPQDSEGHFGHGWSQGQKRTIGLSMAIAAGLMFGNAFNPSQYVIDNHYDGDDNSLNYVFPHFCGIWIASWSYVLLYCIYKWYTDSTPFVNPHCIVPAAISGAMWGIACIAWFIANGKLGFSIAFPLISSGPGFVGSMYGIFLFNEISGKRNFIILGSAFVVTLVGLILITFSHE